MEGHLPVPCAHRLSVIAVAVGGSEDRPVPLAVPTDRGCQPGHRLAGRPAVAGQPPPHRRGGRRARLQHCRVAVAAPAVHLARPPDPDHPATAGRPGRCCGLVGEPPRVAQMSWPRRLIYGIPHIGPDGRASAVGGRGGSDTRDSDGRPGEVTEARWAHVQASMSTVIPGAPTHVNDQHAAVITP